MHKHIFKVLLVINNDTLMRKFIWQSDAKLLLKNSFRYLILIIKNTNQIKIHISALLEITIQINFMRILLIIE